MICPKCGYTKKTRSNPQNAYYWSVIIPMIRKHIGYEPEEIHTVLKIKFLKPMIMRISNANFKGAFDELTFVGDTKSLKTDEFEKYLSDIRSWASKFLGMFIPLPNEVDMY